MNISASLYKLSISAILIASYCASSHAETPLIQKVSPPASIVPLAMSVGGRVSVAPARNPGNFGPEEYVSRWPGTYFSTKFKGSEVYFRIGTNHEILHIVVDEQSPLKLVNPEPAIYRISGLKNSSHSIRIFVVTESQDAPNYFGGFAIQAKEKPLPLKQQSRQIEFIGDSHTVGYGNLSPTNACSNQEVWERTDNSQTFGALTANHYHAAYQINAISGRGVVRNYNGFIGDTLPVAYPYVLFDKKQEYHDPAWKPQIIVIALGTNDFSTPLHAGEKWKTRDELHTDYERTYVSFLQNLRAKNPNAYIVLWATDLANGEIEAEVRKAVQQAKEQGETKLAFIPIDHLQFTGCNSHPSLEDEKTIANKLEQFIDSTPGIWQGK